MKNEKLDQMIAETLHTCGDGIEPMPALRTRVLAGAEPCAKKRPSRLRRTVLACAAAAVLAVTGVVASSGVVTLKSSLSPDEFLKEYAVLAQQVEEKLGEDAVLPESLGDAAFVEGTIDSVEKLSDTGAVLGSFDELSARYVAGDGSEVQYYAYLQDDELTTSAQGTDATEIRSFEETEVTYTLDHYRFVPPDYEWSAEEQAAADAGEIYLSVGSDEVMDKLFARVGWEKDGVMYAITDYDENLTADELFAMAEELIEAE